MATFYLFVLLCVGAVSSNPVFDEDFVQTAIEAAELSILVKSDVVDHSFDYFAYFTEGNNRALVAKKNGVCYGAFKSSMPHFLFELVLRIRAFFTGARSLFEDMCYIGGCCSVRKPTYRQYAPMPYADEFEEAARKCVATCKGKGCPLRLTGHAAGGGVAYLAGIQLADLNPTGYTFGAPEVVHKEGCEALKSDRWYRFVNSVESPHRREYGYPKGGLVYDFVPLAYDKIPNKSYLGSRHLGCYLLLSYDFTIANLGLDEDQRMVTGSLEANAMVIKGADRYHRGYLDRLVAIRDAFDIIGFPVPSGYAQRDLCTVDSECRAPMVCSKACFLCPPRCDYEAEGINRALRSLVAP